MKKLLATITVLAVLVMMGTGAAAAGTTEGEAYTLYDFTKGENVDYTYNSGYASGTILSTGDRTLDGSTSGYLRFPIGSQNGATEIELAPVKNDWSAYNYLNLWVCPFRSSGAKLILRTSGISHWTQGVALDWEGGWRLISIPLNSAGFGNNNDFSNITKLYLKCDTNGTDQYPQSIQLFLNKIWLSTSKPEANRYDAVFEDNFDSASYTTLETNNGTYEVPNVVSKGAVTAHPDDKSAGQANKCIKMTFNQGVNNYLRVIPTQKMTAAMEKANIIRTSFDLNMEPGLRVLVADSKTSHVLLDLVKDNTIKVNTATIGTRWTSGKTTHYTFDYNKQEKTIKIFMDGVQLGTAAANEAYDYTKLTIYLSQWGNTSYAGNSMYIDNIKITAVNNKAVFTANENGSGLYRWVLPEGEQSFSVLKATYDREGFLTDVRSMAVVKPESIPEEIIVSAAGSCDAESTVKYFTWNSPSNLVPIEDAYELK